MEAGCSASMAIASSETRIVSRFPLLPGILLGIGLGGFVDGIVFHQLLQWHHMVTVPFPPQSLSNLKLNTLADGLFHAATWILTFLGLVLLVRARSRSPATWTLRGLVATLLIGFGAFNLAEGVVNHLMLGIHHVNETVPREQWIWWDIGFLGWGAGMLGTGLLLRRADSRHAPALR